MLATTLFPFESSLQHSTRHTEDFQLASFAKKNFDQKIMMLYIFAYSTAQSQLDKFLRVENGWNPSNNNMTVYTIVSRCAYWTYKQQID